MKRNLALLLTLVMCIFCFTACGGGDASSEATSDVASGATSEAASDAGSEAASEGETVEFPGWDYITGKGKIVIGLDDTFAPMGFRDEANNLVGFDIDLAKEVCKRLANHDDIFYGTNKEVLL